MRLLLAEDEKELSRALTAILKHNHYSVDAVYDGADAYEYGRTENYDGIILDIMMPKKDGITVVRDLRKKGNRHAGADADSPFGGGRPDPGA